MSILHLIQRITLLHPQKKECLSLRFLQLLIIYRDHGGRRPLLPWTLSPNYQRLHHACHDDFYLMSPKPVYQLINSREAFFSSRTCKQRDSRNIYGQVHSIFAYLGLTAEHSRCNQTSNHIKLLQHRRCVTLYLLLCQQKDFQGHKAQAEAIWDARINTVNRLHTAELHATGYGFPISSNKKPRPYSL